mmetsp:Transcript_15417/g.37971  ORF Transcript_15417/g.37971 Transcript_15417/m.37971 type:complete len:283 (+) Transcript_15417:1058-1906(+)
MDSRKHPASGTFSDEKHLKHATKSAAVATAATCSTTVNDNCILFGRGKACNNHPANKRMRLIIDRYRDDYQTAGRGNKRKLVQKVHQELVETGMKFLKQEEGVDGWIEADADEAINKVGHALRCHRRGRCKNEAGSDHDQPNVVAHVVSAAAYSDASTHAQILQNKSAGVFRENIAGPLAVPSMSTAAAARFLSSGTNLGHQELLGSALSIASNPLLSLGSIPMQMDLTSLYTGASASIGLAAPPVALNGLSSVDMYVMIEREHQLRQAMLCHHILRNTKQR